MLYLSFVDLLGDATEKIGPVSANIGVRHSRHLYASFFFFFFVSSVIGHIINPFEFLVLGTLWSPGLSHNP